MRLYVRRPPADCASAGLRRRGARPPAGTRRALRRGAHRLLPVLLAVGGGGGAAAAALRAGSRLARGLDAGVLARVPGARGRRGRLRGAADLRARSPARLLLLAPARRQAAGRGPPRPADGARGRVRGGHRAPLPRARRARGRVRRPPDPREARPGDHPRDRACQAQHPRAAGRDLRRRSRPGGGAAADPGAGYGGRRVRARLRRRRPCRRGVGRRALHAAALAPRGLWPGRGGGLRARDPECCGGVSRQRRHRADRAGRERARRALGLARGPGGGDRLGPLRGRRDARVDRRLVRRQRGAASIQSSLRTVAESYADARS